MAQMMFRDALRAALALEMKRDPKVFVIGEEVGRYGGAYAVTKGLYDEFGAERLVDTPISEASVVGLGVGAALTGLRPVVELMYVDFVGLAMDQISNQMAKWRYMSGGKVKVPMVLRTQGGTGRSAGRGTRRAWRRGLRMCPACASSCHRILPTQRGSLQLQSEAMARLSSSSTRPCMR